MLCSHLKIKLLYIPSWSSKRFTTYRTRTREQLPLPKFWPPAFPSSYELFCIDDKFGGCVENVFVGEVFKHVWNKLKCCDSRWEPLVRTIAFIVLSISAMQQSESNYSARAKSLSLMEEEVEVSIVSWWSRGCLNPSHHGRQISTKLP